MSCTPKFSGAVGRPCWTGGLAKRSVKTDPIAPPARKTIMNATAIFQFCFILLGPTPRSRSKVHHFGHGIVGRRRLLLEKALNARVVAGHRNDRKAAGDDHGPQREALDRRSHRPLGRRREGGDARGEAKRRLDFALVGNVAGGGNEPFPRSGGIVHEPSLSLSSAKSFCNFLRARNARTFTSDAFQPVRRLISAIVFCFKSNICRTIRSAGFS